MDTNLERAKARTLEMAENAARAGADALVEGPEEHIPALLGGVIHVRDHQHESGEEQVAKQG